VEVSEDTKERLEKARVISHAAMHVTGGLIEGVTNVAMTLGSAFAVAVKDTDAGKRVQAGASSSTGQELYKVAGAGVHVFANLWNALELSARTVGKATSDATVDVMEHKYGKQAADATRQGFSAAGGAALSVFHVTNIAATSVATYTSSHGDQEQLVTRRQLRDAQGHVRLASSAGIKDATKK
jgi:spartin